MSRARPHLVVVALLGLAGPACRDGSGGARDGGTDAAPAPRDADGTDALAGALAIDFMVSGCAFFSADPPRCTGLAPLAVTFAPIVTGGVSALTWRFGDGTPPSQATTPTHTYRLPGTYDVSVVAVGPRGTAMKTRAAFVVIEPNGVGRLCDVSAQCDAKPGLACLCGSTTTGCAPTLGRGLCSAVCRDAPCAEPGVCVDLSLGGSGAGDEPWRNPICLAACTSDRDCAEGLRCRTLPGRFPAGRWIRACFAREPLDAGAACRKADGNLESSACVSGLCADLGAFGMCTQDCTNQTCQEGLACAAFTNGPRLCVPVCGPNVRCTADDPLLACEQAGGSGARAFSVTGGDPATAYCVPKTCSVATDCAPSGRCVDGRCSR